MSEIVPDHVYRDAFVVRNGKTEQSWVDPSDPLRLEFEYVQRIADVLECSLLARPSAERLRVIHVGGGGLTLPRYIEARRSGTAQIVLEPDVALIDEVRRKLPLPNRAAIKIRPVDGRTGVADLPGGCADMVIVDAFAGATVPGELATAEFFAEVLRLLRTDGLALMNVTDKAPFGWTRRCVAGLAAHEVEVAMIAETPIWRGRRFGNLVVVAGRTLPVPAIELRLARAGFPYRLVGGRDLTRWLGGARPFEDGDTESSPEPPWSTGWC